jgi:hypothetical protein
MVGTNGRGTGHGRTTTTVAPAPTGVTPRSVRTASDLVDVCYETLEDIVNTPRLKRQQATRAGLIFRGVNAACRAEDRADRLDD